MPLILAYHDRGYWRAGRCGLLRVIGERNTITTESSGQVAEVKMIKLVYCFKQESGLRDEEFSRYWETVHGPIGARIPRDSANWCKVTAHHPRRPKPAVTMSMAELWFR